MREISKMKNENKTKDQLIQELIEIQKKIADLEEIIIKEKRVKTELKESEKKYKDLVEETPIGIANIGITGKIIYINRGLEKISGYSREEVLGKNVFKLGIFPDEMLKILKERLKVRLRGGLTHQRREIPFKYKDGKWIWIEITAKLIKKWGIPASLRITVQDITAYTFPLPAAPFCADINKNIIISEILEKEGLDILFRVKFHRRYLKATVSGSKQ